MVLESISSVWLMSCPCRGFKKRAPRAIKEIRKFAVKEMGTPDVRIDTRLNKAVWSKGVRWDDALLILISEQKHMANVAEFGLSHNDLWQTCLGFVCFFFNQTDVVAAHKSTTYYLHTVLLVRLCGAGKVVGLGHISKSPAHEAPACALRNCIHKFYDKKTKPNCKKQPSILRKHVIIITVAKHNYCFYGLFYKIFCDGKM